MYRHAQHTVPNIAPQITDDIDAIDVLEMLAQAALDTQTVRANALATQNVGMLARNVPATINAAEALLRHLPDGDVKPLGQAGTGKALLGAVGAVTREYPATGALIADVLEQQGQTDLADSLRAHALSAAAAQITTKENEK